MTTITSSVGKTLKDYKGTAVNSSIVIVTVVVEELFNRTVFYCPCVEPSELGSCFSTANSANSFLSCTRKLNYYYGLSFIFGPAFALLLIMAAANPSLGKLWTGCCSRKSRSFRLMFWAFGTVVARSLLAPVAWVSFSLLDGKYYSCATTPLPYDVGVNGTYATCRDVAKTSSRSFSDAFRDNMSVSQLFGWSMVGVFVGVGFIAFAISRCLYPLTYYQAKFYSYYSEAEEYEFNDEMKMKAKEAAESNVRKFMSKSRDKALWDRVSSVFSFHRNPNNKALFSYLHEVILKEEKDDPLIIDISTGSICEGMEGTTPINP